MIKIAMKRRKDLHVIRPTGYCADYYRMTGRAYKIGIESYIKSFFFIIFALCFGIEDTRIEGAY